MKKMFFLMVFCMVAQLLTEIPAFDLVLDLLKCIFEVGFWIAKAIAELIIQTV